LEEDTAYVRASVSPDGARTDLLLRIGSQKSWRHLSEVNLTGGYPSGGGQFGGAGYRPERVSLSPTGDYVYFEWSWSINSDCFDQIPTSVGAARVLQGLRGAPSLTFDAPTYTGPPCSTPSDQYPPRADEPEGGLLAWSADGAAFYYGRHFTLSAPQLQRWSVSNGVQNAGPNVSVAANQFHSIVWSPERGRLLTAERRYDDQHCFLRTRAASTPSTILVDSDLGSFYFICAGAQFGPTFLRTSRLSSVTSSTPRPASPLVFSRPFPAGAPRILRVN
jgi:hypothetical protein